MSIVCPSPRLWEALGNSGSRWILEAVELWEALEGFGMLRKALEDFGRHGMALGGFGRFWEALEGFGRLWQPL